MGRYEKALEPFTNARGVNWEVQVVDCDVGSDLPLLDEWSFTNALAPALEPEWYGAARGTYRGRKNMEITE